MILLHSTIIGKGHPLIIAHGYFGMGDNWKSIATKLATHFEVHLLDLRNHGRSFHSDDFNYDVMVEDVLFYIKHYQLKNVILLGHSMGGKMAMQFAVIYSEYLSKLIVVDIAPKYYPPHHEAILTALNNVNFDKITSRREVSDIFKKYIDEESVIQFLLKNVYWESKTQLAFRFNLESLTENNNEVGEALPSFTSFDKPVLFLKGDSSGYISTDDAPLIKGHFSKAEIVTIENASHWVHADNPSQFYEAVFNFITD